VPKHRSAIFFGKVQIQQDQIRTEFIRRTLGSMNELYGLMSVMDLLHVRVDLCRGDGFTYQKDISLTVLHNQNSAVVFQRRFRPLR